MEKIKTEIMQQLDNMDKSTLQIVLGFVRKLAQMTGAGQDSQRG